MRHALLAQLFCGYQHIPISVACSEAFQIVDQLSRFIGNVLHQQTNKLFCDTNAMQLIIISAVPVVKLIN